MAMTQSKPEGPSIPISPGRWIAYLFVILAIIIGLNFLVAWRLDLFGLFRDARGRSLATSEHERKQKYLLNRNYVPENFNALIIGASASVNWRPEELSGFQFYNESLEGGDASEERKMVEQALGKGQIKAAIITLFPRITSQHVLQDGFETANESEALGSISLLGVEYEYLAGRVFHRPPKAWPNGSHRLPPRRPPSETEAHTSLAAVQDATAVTDYVELANELSRRGVALVYVVVPVYEPYLVSNKGQFDAYTQTMLLKLPPAAVVDFNGPEYLAFRSNPANYRDLVHLSPAGAETISALLNTRLVTLLGERK